MIRLFGSSCGLIVFSATILVGLVTGAEPAVLIPRAVQAMIGGVALGLVAGWLGMHIIRDGIEIENDSDTTAGLDAHEKVGDATVAGN